MAQIETEIRSFIAEEKYKELLSYFKKHSKFLNKDFQESYYFNTKEDLRVQRNKKFAKIWLKKGKIHDESREEIEVKFDRADFDKLEKIFSSIGLKVEIKWFRERNEFLWQGINVCLDYTKGYGYIIELEKICREKDKEKVLKTLKDTLKSLNIKLTARSEFEKKFAYYKKNWKGLMTSPTT